MGEDEYRDETGNQQEDYQGGDEYQEEVFFEDDAQEAESTESEIDPNADEDTGGDGGTETDEGEEEEEYGNEEEDDGREGYEQSKKEYEDLQDELDKSEEKINKTQEEIDRLKEEVKRKKAEEKAKQKEEKAAKKAAKKEDKKKAKQESNNKILGGLKKAGVGIFGAVLAVIVKIAEIVRSAVGSFIFGPSFGTASPDQSYYENFDKVVSENEKLRQKQAELERKLEKQQEEKEGSHEKEKDKEDELETENHEEQSEEEQEAGNSQDNEEQQGSSEADEGEQETENSQDEEEQEAGNSQDSEEPKAGNSQDDEEQKDNSGTDEEEQETRNGDSSEETENENDDHEAEDDKDKYIIPEDERNAFNVAREMATKWSIYGYPDEMTYMQSSYKSSGIPCFVSHNQNSEQLERNYDILTSPESNKFYSNVEKNLGIKIEPSSDGTAFYVSKGNKCCQIPSAEFIKGNATDFAAALNYLNAGSKIGSSKDSLDSKYFSLALNTVAKFRKDNLEAGNYKDKDIRGHMDLAYCKTPAYTAKVSSANVSKDGTKISKLHYAISRDTGDEYKYDSVDIKGGGKNGFHIDAGRKEADTFMGSYRNQSDFLKKLNSYEQEYVKEQKQEHGDKAYVSLMKDTLSNQYADLLNKGEQGDASIDADSSQSKIDKLYTELHAGVYIDKLHEAFKNGIPDYMQKAYDNMAKEIDKLEAAAHYHVGEKDDQRTYNLLTERQKMAIDNLEKSANELKEVCSEMIAEYEKAYEDLTDIEIPDDTNPNLETGGKDENTYDNSDESRRIVDYTGGRAGTIQHLNELLDACKESNGKEVYNAFVQTSEDHKSYEVIAEAEGGMVCISVQGDDTTAYYYPDDTAEAKNLHDTFNQRFEPEHDIEAE